MRISISTGFYLWTHTWQRWHERPGSPLARGLVTILLTALSAGVLSAYRLSELDLELRLERQGLETLVIRQHETRFSSATGSALESRFGELKKFGEATALTIALGRARNDIDGRSSPLVKADIVDWPSILKQAQPDAVGFLVTDAIAPGLPVRRFDQMGEHLIRTAQPEHPLLLAAGGPAFVYADARHLASAPAREHVLIFSRANSAPQIDQIAEALRVIIGLDRLEEIELQSSDALRKQWRRMRDTRFSVQIGLGLLMGCATALVFGTLAVLEYRETRHTVALLRSLGGSTVLIAVQKLIEGALLANVCFALSFAVWCRIGPLLFENLGFENEIVSRAGIAGWLSGSGELLAWLNLGVVASILPLAAALRLPIGRVLE